MSKAAGSTQITFLMFRLAVEFCLKAVHMESPGQLVSLSYFISFVTFSLFAA
ncbi:hypothetical protein CCACVL1_02932 [Corchorus capsularis]|uniref:Uncharacterized protein n=1 Tax=Corchorus capsularis TaxID=210143 RepID=A0A1R3K4N1_COCAP|nr:hypothetical protein CCACVL1_02932 [Corchorus capsularis]